MILQEFLTKLGFQVDEKALKQGQDKIGKAAEMISSKIESSFKPTGMLGEALSFAEGVAGSTAVAIAGVAAAAGAVAFSTKQIVDGANEAAQEYHELTLMAMQLGTSAEEVDKFNDTFAAIGVSGAQTNQMMETFSRNVADAAKGMGRATQVFEKYGIAVKDANGEARPAMEIMEELRSKMAGMDRASQVSISERLGLGKEFLKQFEYNVSYIEEMQKRMSAAAGENFDSNVDAAEEYTAGLRGVGTEWNLLGWTVGKFKQQGFVAVFKALQPLLAKFQSWIASLRERIAASGENIMRIFRALATVVGGVLTAAFNILAPVVSIIVDAFFLLVDVVGRTIQTVQWLLNKIDDFTGGRLSSFLLWIADQFEILSLKVQIFARDFSQAYDQIVGYFDKLFGDVDTPAKFFDAIKTLATDAAEWIKKQFLNLFPSPTEFAANALEALGGPGVGTILGNGVRMLSQGAATGGIAAGGQTTNQVSVEVHGVDQNNAHAVGTAAGKAAYNGARAAAAGAR